jgi:hypothetical protein
MIVVLSRESHTIRDATLNAAPSVVGNAYAVTVMVMTTCLLDGLASGREWLNASPLACGLSAFRDKVGSSAAPSTPKAVLI